MDKIDPLYGVVILKGRDVGRKGRLPKIVRIRGVDKSEASSVEPFFPLTGEGSKDICSRSNYQKAKWVV